MTLVAAVQALLSRYANTDDVAVGTVTAGRGPRRAGGPRRLLRQHRRAALPAWTGAAPFADLLADVRETVLEAFAHDEVPFDRLVEELQPERDPSRTPLVRRPGRAADRDGTPARGRPVCASPSTICPARRPGSTWSSSSCPRDDSLELGIEYNTDLFDPATVERLAGHLQRLLAAVVGRRRHGRWREIDMLGAQERDRLLVEWNDTDRTVPAGDAGRAVRGPGGAYAAGAGAGARRAGR